LRVLLLEDDGETARTVARALGLEGHQVLCARDVPEALRHAETAPLGAAVLDVGVPGGSGYDVLDHLRQRSAHLPVLMLTARDAVADRVEGLDRGADDYLVKPFSLAELAARLRALERRGAPPLLVLRRADLVLDPVTRRCRVGTRELGLTPLEFDLLACLLREDGNVVGRDQLLREVWRVDFDPGTNVVDVHVYRLRRKLDDAEAGARLRTVRGRGYALV